MIRFAWEVLPYLRKVRRNKAGRPWSLEDAAAKYRERYDRPFTRSMLLRYEKGTTTPDADTAGKLADMYGVPVDSLFNDGKPMDAEGVRTHVAAVRGRG